MDNTAVNQDLAEQFAYAVKASVMANENKTMTNKAFNAQEMRDMADAIGEDLCANDHMSVVYTYDDLISVIGLLRQAADMMEREEQREKKYEYSLKEPDGTISFRHHDDFDSLGCDYREEGNTPVRREVGEWEEVK